MTKESKTSEKQELIITRVFNAPRTLVFKAFSETESLAQWWGPKGMDITIKKLEFQPGGIFHFCMTAPDNSTMWAKFTYREILSPERIVFVNSFSDSEGNIIKPPFDDNWPTEMLNTFTFTENNGKTTLTLQVEAINASEEEIKTFTDNHPSMQGGYGGTFDQLDECLAKA